MRKRSSAQRGMVLLLCMIFLTALMLLGLSASADTILQTRLTSNLKNSETVKQSAQIALEAGEKWLLTKDTPSADICRPPCDYPLIHMGGKLPVDVQTQPLAWWLAHGQVMGDNPISAHNGNDPSVWLIESAHEAPVADSPDMIRTWYRILARASDPTGVLISVVESIVFTTRPTNEGVPATENPKPTSCATGSSVCKRVAWRRLR